MPEGIHDCLLLLRRTNKHSALSRSDVIVPAFLKTSLVLNLSDIVGRNRKPIFLKNIRLDLRICCTSRFAFQLLDIQINVDMSVNLFVT